LGNSLVRELDAEALQLSATWFSSIPGSFLVDQRLSLHTSGSVTDVPSSKIREKYLIEVRSAESDIGWARDYRAGGIISH
jgi:hypothetical protein